MMCSETGKEIKKKGKPVNVIETVLHVKPGAGYVVLQETVGLCLLLPAGNGTSAAMGLCRSAGSAELKLPMRLLSSHLCFF